MIQRTCWEFRMNPVFATQQRKERLQFITCAQTHVSVMRGLKSTWEPSYCRWHACILHKLWQMWGHLQHLTGIKTTQSQRLPERRCLLHFPPASDFIKTRLKSSETYQEAVYSLYQGCKCYASFKYIPSNLWIFCSNKTYSTGSI